MRMTQTVLVAAWLFRNSKALLSRTTTSTITRTMTLCISNVVSSSQKRNNNSVRLFSVSNGIEADVMLGVSRIETLQTLLSRHGAPGSLGCNLPDGDLEPIFVPSSSSSSSYYRDETPELISTFLGINDYVNLHPHLYPLAKSKTSGNLICALKRVYSQDDAASERYEKSSKASPWPIVEAKIGGPGMRLLALNSEHLMRRIVCECDFSGERTELVKLYNEKLEKNHNIGKNGLDQPYEPGSVEKLGHVDRQYQ